MSYVYYWICVHDDTTTSKVRTFEPYTFSVSSVISRTVRAQPQRRLGLKGSAPLEQDTWTERKRGGAAALSPVLVQGGRSASGRSPRWQCALRRLAPSLAGRARRTAPRAGARRAATAPRAGWCAVVWASLPHSGRRRAMCARARRRRTRAEGRWGRRPPSRHPGR